MGIISIYGLSQKKFTIGEMTLFQKVVTELLSPIQSGIVSSQQSFSSFIDNYFRIVNTNKENRFLRNKINSLEAELFQLQVAKKENARLKGLLNYSKEIPFEKIMAKVIGWDSSNQFKVLRINKGERDGIKALAPVITHQGLVGYIYRVGVNYSDILTILDPNNRVDSIVERTRTHGIVEGILNNRCVMKYVVKNEPLEIGDRLLTAGVGGVYPKGIKVGIVTQIHKENTGLTLNVELTPSVDFHRLEEVIVLKDKREKLLNKVLKQNKEGSHRAIKTQ